MVAENTPGASPAEAPKTERLSFDAWLEYIERHRRMSGKDAKTTWIKEKKRDVFGATNAAFTAFKTDENLWDGVHAPKIGSPLYDKIIMGLNFTAEIMGENSPFSSTFMEWAMGEGGYLRKSLAEIAGKENDDVHYDLWRAEMLKDFGNALKAKGGVGNVFKEGTLNNTYVTQVGDQWVPISEDKVAELLKASGKPEGGPHVVITANHAFLESMDDLTPITKGYAEVIKKATQTREPYEEIEKGEDGVEKTVQKVKITETVKLVPYEEGRTYKSDETILIAAASTFENNYLNLDQLFRRLYDVEQQLRGPQRDESGVALRPNDTFEHVSPIAKMMVSTILKSIVADEDLKRIELSANQAPPRFVKGEGPIKLRADAIDVLRKAYFMGFSKGGNDYRDGMRLLVHTLTEEVNGEHIFQPQVGTLKDIISHVSVTAQSMNEKPMHAYYQDNGVSVTWFSNLKDKIALPRDSAFSESNDPGMAYGGDGKFNGHYPGIIAENLDQAPYIMQHYRCVLAPLSGYPAIRFALFESKPDVANPGTNKHSIVLKTSTGTTDAMMNAAIPTIEKAFQNFVEVEKMHDSVLGKEVVSQSHTLKNIGVRAIPDTHGTIRFELYSKLENGTTQNRSPEMRALDKKAAEEELFSSRTLRCLHDAFEQLRYDQDNGLVVSSAVAYPNLTTLKSDTIHARRTHDADYLDKVVITGDKVFDANMEKLRRLNEMGRGNFDLPDRADIKDGVRIYTPSASLDPDQLAKHEQLHPTRQPGEIARALGQEASTRIQRPVYPWDIERFQKAREAAQDDPSQQQAGSGSVGR